MKWTPIHLFLVLLIPVALLANFATRQGDPAPQVNPSPQVQASAKAQVKAPAKASARAYPSIVRKRPSTAEFLTLPDKAAKDWAPYLTSWKDNSHLWVLKQTEAPVELKLWDVKTGEYKVVSSLPHRPFRLFSPALMSGVVGQSGNWGSATGYTGDDKHLVFVQANKPEHKSGNKPEVNQANKPANKPDPINIGNIEPIYLSGHYLLQEEMVDWPVISVRVWDMRSGIQKETITITAPKDRQFWWESDPGTDHGVGIGTSLGINYPAGIGAIASMNPSSSGLGKDRLHIFKTKTGQYLHHIELKEHSAYYTILITPDGKKVVTITDAGPETDPQALIEVWSVRTGKLLWRYLSKAHGIKVSVICISPDGKKLAAKVYLPSKKGIYMAGWKIDIWDLATGKLQRSSPPRQDVDVELNYGPESLSFSPDNRYLAISEGDGYVTVWRIRK